MMNPDKVRLNKVLTVALLWGLLAASFAIRYALSVVAPTLMKLYGISPKTMGYVLSGWNWSVTISTLFVGPIIDRFGVWATLGVASGVWGLATVALPAAHAPLPLFLMRAIFGAGQSLLLPGIAYAVSRWFGSQERAWAIAAVFSASQLGAAAGGTSAAFILSRLGWQAVFYCIGSGSLLLTLAWFYFYPDKTVGKGVALDSGQSQSGSQPRIPAHHGIAGMGSLISLLRYRSTWGMALGQFGYIYAYYFFISWLPGYLILERKMTLLKSGIIGALPFWVGMISTLGGGWLGDSLIRRGVRPTVSRKSIIGIALAMGTILVIAAGFSKETWLAVTLLILCMAFIKTPVGSVNALPIDLAPATLVGTLSAIQCFFGDAGGLVATVATGYIVDFTGSFIGAMVAAGGMALCGAICYVFVMGNLDRPMFYEATAGKAEAALHH